MSEANTLEGPEVKCTYCGKGPEPGRPVQLVAIGMPNGDAEVVRLHQNCERGYLRLLDDPSDRR